MASVQQIFQKPLHPIFREERNQLSELIWGLCFLQFLWETGIKENFLGNNVEVNYAIVIFQIFLVNICQIRW